MDYKNSRKRLENCKYEKNTLLSAVIITLYTAGIPFTEKHLKQQTNWSITIFNNKMEFNFNHLGVHFYWRDI